MQENRQEKSQIKQNILLYLSKKDVSAYEFYNKSGVTRGILTQNNGISEDNLARFLAYAPDVNIEWLLTGKGDMLRRDQQAPLDNPTTTAGPKEGIPGPVMEYIPEDLLIIRNVFHSKRNTSFPRFRGSGSYPQFPQLL